MEMVCIPSWKVGKCKYKPQKECINIGEENNIEDLHPVVAMTTVMLQNYHLTLFILQGNERCKFLRVMILSFGNLK